MQRRAALVLTLVLVLASVAGLIACTGAPSSSVASSPAAATLADAPPEPAPVALPQAQAAAPAPQLDPDGNDDPDDPGTGTAPTAAHFERVGIAPKALERICDLTPFAGSLYAAHANQPLGTDGATLTRYTPLPAEDGGRPKNPFHMAFDWNRPGEPAEGGGAGQGFLRVHSIDGRLFVPDADPPYNGFGIVEGGTEGYVFLSDTAGAFAKATGEHFHPPGVPRLTGADAGARGAGAAVLPRAYHVIDVIKFRGRLYASTGSVPPTEHAWRGPSPGALQVANESWSRFTYEVDYPFPWQNGVWRLGFMTRFKDALYAGIQDYDGREPNDYVVFHPEPGTTVITHEDVHPHRIVGTLQTLRWYTDGGRLYWVTLSRDSVGALHVSDDGETWRDIDLPEDAGRPTDITRFRDALVVLTERGLYRLAGEVPVLVARVTEKKTPFVVSDFFCAAPIAVFQNELYAGSQRNGALYRLVDD